jgi:CubicO group peptidase (beta-lactamase class C family)
MPFSIPLRFAVVLAVACGDSTGVDLAHPGQVGDGNLAAVLEAVCAEHQLPALAAMLVQDGEVVEQAAIGVRAVGHDEGVTLDDHWHIGSLTKAMTATLAAVLVERGTLDWSLTVGEALPDIVDSIRPAYVDVRLDELLHHVGGMVENVMRAPSWSTLRSDTTPVRQLRKRFAAELLALPPDAPRGTYHYSNAGYIVAGAMIEAVTGEQWEDLMRREVFTPLGMTHTGFGAPGTASAVTEPWGHVGSPGRWQAVPPGPFADNPAALGPAGTINTTLADYARFVSAHLAGARGEPGGWLAPATFALLHTPAPGSSYAFGWGVAERSWAGGRVLQHAGSNTMWYATVWIAPERNIALFAVTNVGGDAGAQGTDAAVAALVRRVQAADGGGQ